MTITFTPNTITRIPASIRVACLDDCNVLHFAADEDGMTLAYGIHVCDVCGGQAFHETEYVGEELPSVNVSNANAAAILDRLGYEFDHVGVVDAEDFLGRVLVANVGRDDSGVPVSEDRIGSGARLIDCGVRAGYYDDRMAALVDVARAAIAAGVEVAWS